MARKATLPFMARQIQVARLMVALKALKLDVDADTLEMALAEVPVVFGAVSKAELKAKLEANAARIAELEAALKAKTA